MPSSPTDAPGEAPATPGSPGAAGRPGPEVSGGSPRSAGTSAVSDRRGGAVRPARRAPSRRRGVQWRKWNRILHRDLGYLCAGLTLVYAASGLAVNHVHDWNPNYSVRQETVAFPLPGPEAGGAPASGEAGPGTDAWARSALGILGVTADYRGTFRPDPATVDIFVDGGAVTVDLAAAEATVEVVQTRPILRRANFLHLNEARGLWTWMADLYAVALFLLALTGLFVIKGRKGITGRGAWLTAVGVAVPLAFLLLYF